MPFAAETIPTVRETVPQHTHPACRERERGQLVSFYSWGKSWQWWGRHGGKHLSKGRFAKDTSIWEQAFGEAKVAPPWVGHFIKNSTLPHIRPCTLNCLYTPLVFTSKYDKTSWESFTVNKRSPWSPWGSQASPFRSSAPIGWKNGSENICNFWPKEDRGGDLGCTATTVFPIVTAK